MDKINKPYNSPRAMPPKPPVKETPKVEVVKLVTPEVVVPQDYQDDDLSGRIQAIPPATEPMQYRAIGIVRGRYIPTEEHFSKGSITTADGTIIDTVVLGKVIPILKKRLDLEKEYLWVVYPRTIEKTAHLHVQIAGVWAPSEMGKSEQEIDPGNDDGYFSIRGEVVEQSLSENYTIVKIKRADHRTDAQKAEHKDYISEQKKPPGASTTKFKLTLSGILPNNPLGYFWDIKVKRQGNALAISYAKAIAPIPKKPPRKPIRKTDNNPQFKAPDLLPKLKPNLTQSGLTKPSLEKESPSRPIKRPKI